MGKGIDANTAPNFPTKRQNIRYTLGPFGYNLP